MVLYVRMGGVSVYHSHPIQFVYVLLYLCLNCALVVNFAQNNEELLTSKNQPHDYNTASSGNS